VEIKICGLTREGDAEGAAQAGADRIGAILVPGTPRQVSATEARGLKRAAGLPLTVVVADLSPARMAEQAERAEAAAIQMHGGESVEDALELRQRGPWELWKAVRVRSQEEIGRAVEGWLGAVDLLLLDGWHPHQLGGTGVSFPWEALEGVRAGWPADLRLGAAGGLSPDNVAEAVRRLRPDLIDVSSGVEFAPGLKDPVALRAFVAQARSAIHP